MIADTDMEEGAETRNLRQRGHTLVDAVADRVARGDVVPSEMSRWLDELQRLKDRPRSAVRVVDANTRAVTITVNHNGRVIKYADCTWTTEENREESVPRRTGTEEFEVVLRRFGSRTSSDEVIAVFEREDFQPLTPEEHVALFGAMKDNPDLPIPIASLGASWRFPGGRRGGPVSGRGRGQAVPPPPLVRA